MQRPVQLTTTTQAVVTGIPNTDTTFAAREITYSFSAATAAGVVAVRPASVILELAP